MKESDEKCAVAKVSFEIQRILISMGCLTTSQKLSTPKCWEKREDHKGWGLEKPWGLLELLVRPKARLWPFWDLEVKQKRLHLLWKEQGQWAEDIQVLYSCGPSCRKAWSVVFKAYSGFQGMYKSISFGSDLVLLSSWCEWKVFYGLSTCQAMDCCLSKRVDGSICILATWNWF